MTPSFVSAAEHTRLTPAEVRVAEQMVTGQSNVEAAQALHMQPSTFRRHLTKIGWKFQVTSRPARAHAVLNSGQVAPPATSLERPDLSEEDLRLLTAVAEHSENPDIARAASVHRAEVRSKVAGLVKKVEADNPTHLVGLAHSWGLIGSGRTAAVIPGSSGLDHRRTGARTGRPEVAALLALDVRQVDASGTAGALEASFGDPKP